MDEDVILKEVEKIVNSIDDKEGKLKKICKLLEEKIDHYDWVGFYLMEDGKLELGPYIGEPTHHTSIDIGQGVCGQAADREETYLVQDVDEEENYLSCSPKVKSEIVVPIFKQGKIAGEIDIDSHELEAFSDEDEKLLESIAERVGKIL